jgi:Tat protein translocase TatB subunit
MQNLFGIGPLEIAVIMVFALIFVGPQKLPELARQFGRFFVQMKRVTSDVRGTVDEYMRKAENEILQEEREKIRALIEKEVLNPARTIEADIKDGIHSSEDSSHHDPHHNEHHDHHHSHEDSHHGTEEDTLGNRATSAPVSTPGKKPEWES